MELNSSYHGACPAPFYDASLFPTEGGFVAGRLCALSDLLPGNPTCCLPCPATYWTYPDSFATYNAAAAWLNVVGFILLIFLLISYFFLPVQKTRSHYLSVSLVVAVLFLNLGFIVPLGAQPKQCYNAITPNDMYSSKTCAWSGAFIVAGGLSGAVWILVRALSMHLQICWDIVPGRKFFFVSQALGWGVPAILFALTLAFTGVSFRFGNACHVNHDESMKTFWGWLLAFSSAAVILQLGTFGYCIHVFITNLWSDAPPTASSNSNSLPTYSASVRTQTAKAIWRRLKSVLFLQWRGILIVTVCLVDVIFFAVVFVYLDDLESSLITSYERAEPWLLCLVESGGNKNACLALSEKWLIKESIVGAVLIMLSLIGLAVFCLLFRFSFLIGWRDFLHSKLGKQDKEFVSLDALQQRPPSRSDTVTKRSGANGVAFEMQTPATTTTTTKQAYTYTDMDAKNLSPIITTTSISSPYTTFSSPSSYISPSSGHHFNSFSPPHFGTSDTPEPGFSDYYASQSRSLSRQTPTHSPFDTTSSMVRSPSDASSLQRQALRSFERGGTMEEAGSESSRTPSYATVQSMGWDPTSSFASSSSHIPSHGHTPNHSQSQSQSQSRPPVVGLGVGVGRDGSADMGPRRVHDGSFDSSISRQSNRRSDVSAFEPGQAL